MATDVSVFVTTGMAGRVKEGGDGARMTETYRALLRHYRSVGAYRREGNVRFELVRRHAGD